jgi:hypothetical protein
MGNFATGVHAIALCDRCGQEYEFHKLRQEWNGLKTCPSCFETKHPQLDPSHHRADAEALPWARPGREEPMIVFVGNSGDSSFESNGMQPSNNIKKLEAGFSVGSVTISTASTTTYTVTVAAKADGSGNAFYIDGVQAPALTINEGSSAIFNLSNSTVNHHPFYLSTTSGGSHSGGSVYTTGVTFKINGSSVSQSAYASGYSSATSRALEITVAIGAPTLYYYCSSHSGMGNSISTP